MNQQGSQKIDAYRRASNYPAAGQLYLPDTPLLRRPLKREDVKRKLIAHKNCIHEIGQDICCAMSGKQSLAKKEWLKQRFAEGLVFYRSVERGKCFIEYIPAENA